MGDVIDITSRLPDKLLTPQEFARFLGINLGTLDVWRHKGDGPKFVRVGRHIRYRWSDIEMWMNANTRQSTATT